MSSDAPTATPAASHTPAAGGTVNPDGITIPRRFTTAGVNPFSLFTWERRDSKILNPDGSVVSELNDVEVPTHWDQGALDIVTSKYFRKAGVPQTDPATGEPLFDDAGAPVLGPEQSVRQVIHRLANAWKVWGERGGYFATPADADAFYAEIAYMQVAQMAAPNSPQWFNTGLFEAYGIVAEPEGNWYVDPATGEARESEHRYERSAANACFILAPDDQLVGEGSIMRHFENEARLFKSGSGSGGNFSHIREAGAKLSAGGTSSGVMSFLKVGDVSAGSIKSGGTTRRAAKMVILDADHPDIEEFIWCKVREEEKVAALVAGGFSNDWQGEAYETVAFQNANHSVRLPAGFMASVAADEEWALLSRVDGSTVRTVKARELWHQIAEAAWRCADPGVQFDDILNDWNTVADTEVVRGTNPCSEFVHVDNTACNLASLNLGAFYDADSCTFDVDGYAHAARLWTVVLEVTVHMSHYPTREVAVKSYAHRPLGLGVANLGALLMRAGLPYDSDQGRAAMGAMNALMHHVGYATSAELAAAVGACDAFAPNRDSALRVIRNHRRAAYGTLAASHGVGPFESLSVAPVELDHLTLAHTPFAPLSPAVRDWADAALSGAETHGLRNMQLTVAAPTGTISFVMGADTTGIEPEFALVKFKKLAGGGYMRIVNGSVPAALRALGYDEAANASIMVHLLGTQTLHGNTAVNADRLAAAGLTELEVARAETASANVSSLIDAFGPWVVGDDAYTRLGADPAGAGAALLAAAGFTPAEVRESSLAVCGHLTTEGAPGLRPEHAAVFDCAVECGDGSRVISWEGHVRALGAIAPFLSGSASKTVNLPNTATVDDIESAHDLAYRLGVKCIAVYRDGSKLSQPLSSAGRSDAEDGDDSDGAVRLPTEVPEGMSPGAFYAGTTPPRFRLLPHRRGSTWRFTVGGEEVYLRTGEYEDGTLGEVFIDWGRQGSTMRGITAATSIMVSQALQHGVPLAKIVDSLRGHMFEPAGVVSGHPNLKMAASPIDAIVRILGHHYLERDDLVQVPSRRADAPAQEAPATKQASVVPAAAPAVEDAGSTAPIPEGAERVIGATCTQCGSQALVKTGTCSTCTQCGSTSGCA